MPGPAPRSASRLDQASDIRRLAMMRWMSDQQSPRTGRPRRVPNWVLSIIAVPYAIVAAGGIAYGLSVNSSTITTLSGVLAILIVAFCAWLLRRNLQDG